MIQLYNRILDSNEKELTKPTSINMDRSQKYIQKMQGAKGGTQYVWLALLLFLDIQYLSLMGNMGGLYLSAPLKFGVVT